MLIVERRDNVLLLTLNRVEKRNSLHPDLIGQLSGALADVADDESLNVVVITGAGTTFCAGLDLNHLLGLETAGKIAYVEDAFALFRRIYTLPQPVIAAVNGPAVAGGFEANLERVVHAVGCRRQRSEGQQEQAQEPG